MIEARQIGDALRYRFGSSLAEESGIWDRAVTVLRGYAAYRDTFDDLAVRLEDAVFNALYEHLGPSMGAKMDDGTVRRIRMPELKDAADDVMGVLFDTLKVYSVTYDSLHDYSMRTGSVAAMRVLYTRFRDFMPSSERRIMARIIRDSRPRSWWADWLDPEDAR